MDLQRSHLIFQKATNLHSQRLDNSKHTTERTIFTTTKICATLRRPTNQTNQNQETRPIRNSKQHDKLQTSTTRRSKHHHILPPETTQILPFHATKTRPRRLQRHSNKNTERQPTIRRPTQRGK